MDERTLVCPACHHAEHDPGSCPECPRCELHFDEAADWLRRNGQDKTAMWREMFAAVGEQWAIVLDRLDLAEDATADDVLAALATADKPLTGRDESAAAKLAAWFEWAKYVAPTDQPGWHHWWAKAFLNDGPIPVPTAPALDVELRKALEALPNRGNARQGRVYGDLIERRAALAALSPTTETPE
jgi:hypothetical protein